MISLLRQFTANQHPAEFLLIMKALHPNLYCLAFHLTNRAFKSCTNFELFHQKLNNVKLIFKNNGYSICFTDLCIEKASG